MAAFVAQSPSFRAADLAKLDTKSVWELLDVDFPATFSQHDGESASAFLDRLGFPDGARHLALEVFARSFFARPDEFSAGELVGMFHSYFLGSSEGLLFDVPVDDYDAMFWAPLRDYLERLGVTVRTEETARRLDLDGAQVAVQTDTERLTADAIVLATDLRATRRLLEESNGLLDQDWRSRVAETVNAPRFAVWRLWLDRRVNADRPPFLGTSGYGPLDNVTVLERFEAGARRWSDAHDASVVEVHAYALPPGRTNPYARRCGPNLPGSTPKPRAPTSSRRSGWSPTTARWSARVPGCADPRWPRRTNGWCWRATASGATTRWP